MEKKIEIIKQNKDVIIQSINKYLDKIYDIKDTFFGENGKLKQGLERDEQVEKFISDLNSNIAPNLEVARRKLLDNNYELNSKDFAYIKAALIYIYGVWEIQIKELTEAKSEIGNLIKDFKS